MAKRLHLDMELPDELFNQLRQEEIEKKVKEALVMGLLREHRLFQGKAAEILGIGHHESCTSGRAGGLICEPLKAVWPATPAFPSYSNIFS